MPVSLNCTHWSFYLDFTNFRSPPTLVLIIIVQKKKKDLIFNLRFRASKSQDRPWKWGEQNLNVILKCEREESKLLSGHGNHRARGGQ